MCPCTQVQGRILFPAAGMLEMSLAAASMLCTLGSTCAALVGCSISAPLVMKATQTAVLSCTASLADGQLELASGTPHAVRKHMAVHTGELISHRPYVSGHACMHEQLSHPPLVRNTQVLQRRVAMAHYLMHPHQPTRQQ